MRIARNRPIWQKMGAGDRVRVRNLSPRYGI